MSLVDDVLKVLDRIPIWKRLQQIPGEVDELKERIASLEERLGDKWPPDVCKFCGTRALRLRATFAADKGKVRQQWQCGECTKTEIRIV